MKTVALIVVLAAGVASAEPTAFDRIAVAAQVRVTFQPDACTLTVPTGKTDVAIPLRTVTWSLSTSEGVALATARCPARTTCIGTTSRHSLKLTVTGKEARRVLADLKGLSAQCTH